MTTESTFEQPVTEPSVAVSDEQLIAMLVDRARSEGLQLTGQGGWLQQLTKRVLESPLEGEITDHVGYDKHNAAGRGSGNSRNGTRGKTVLTDVGPIEVRVPRDTAGTFELVIVKKRQRRLTGVDEMVLSLSAKGLTPSTPPHSALASVRATSAAVLVSKPRRFTYRRFPSGPIGSSRTYNHIPRHTRSPDTGSRRRSLRTLPATSHTSTLRGKNQPLT